jgi:hypothetical protein
MENRKRSRSSALRLLVLLLSNGPVEHQAAACGTSLGSFVPQKAQFAQEFSTGLPHCEHVGRMA